MTISSPQNDQPVETLFYRFPQSGASVSWVFLRLIALIYLAAFASLLVQVKGLIGVDGILPLGEYLDQARQGFGSQGWWRIPTLFWFDSSDLALKWACWAGMASSLLVLFNRLAWLGLLLCYALYLSLVHAGQIFMSFQWDVFLLECGFLALFLTGGSPIVIWLYRFLLFRFMLMGGVVKLASGDPSWSQLTALHYHFETQPLPSPLAWYAHLLPEPVLQAGTLVVFFIELVVPFFVFLNRSFRLFAAASFFLLQGTIMLTGNYNFFNILTIALCVFLFDDRDIRRVLPAKLAEAISLNARSPGTLAHASAGLMGLVTLSTCGALLWLSNIHEPPIQPFYGLAKLTSAFGIVNGYGPFAVMTTVRREIILEGSDSGQTWLAYEFKYKPGDLKKPLTWNIPHQPRLDWQMWFAALGDLRDSPWIFHLMARLREGSKPVLSLLQDNPFPNHPPKYLRASIYKYSFTTPAERNASGHIWKRKLLQIIPVKDEPWANPRAWIQPQG